MLIDEQQSRWKVVILRENVDGWTIIVKDDRYHHPYLWFMFITSLLNIDLFFIYKKWGSTISDVIFRNKYAKLTSCVVHL